MKGLCQILHNEEGNRNAEGLKLILFKDKILNIWPRNSTPRNVSQVTENSYSGKYVYLLVPSNVIHIT